MNSSVQSSGTVAGRSRWWAFGAVCLGFHLVIIEGMVVTIALPSIQSDLGFSELSLIWVVNAYLIPYSGFLLVGGRLSDLLGARRLFLFGILIFTAASVLCGLAESRASLIGARVVQGLGGSVIASVSFSLTMSLFSEDSERATALNIFNFVNSCGSAVALVLGGTLTGLLNWHWIFLINLPFGAAAYALCLLCLPDTPRLSTVNRLDFGGAVSVTLSLTLTVYSIVNGSKLGWHSAQTIVAATGAVVSLILFLHIESRVPTPIIPLSLFRRRPLVIANIIFILWCFAGSSWYFASSLYMRTVLKYDAVQVGLTFLPLTLAGATLQLGFCNRLVKRFGAKPPMVVGLLIASSGMLLFARAPVHGHLVADVLPGMLLMGIGTGMASTPTFLIAMKGMAQSESGFVSGIICTASMMGSALGLATLVSAASAHTSNLLSAGVSLLAALNGGYHVTFALGATLLASAPLIGAALLASEKRD